MSGYALQDCARCGGLVRSPHSYCEWKGLGHVEEIRPVAVTETPVLEGLAWSAMMAAHSAEAEAQAATRMRRRLETGTSDRQTSWMVAWSAGR